MLDYALRSSIHSPTHKVLDFNRLDPSALSGSHTKPEHQDVGDCTLLHHAFERNVREKPAAPALDFLQEDGQRNVWSYEDLGNEANRIARRLLEHGVGPEQAIPIHLPKSPLFYASILGVLKVGAVFSPFDTAAPADRKRYMLQELNAQLVISEEALDHGWCDAKILKASENVAIERQSESKSIQSANLAYHIYTSGSTGQPKAVSIEHRNAVQTIAASRSLLPWKPSSRLLQFASTTFDMCYYDCFIAWSYGICLCAAPQATMFNSLPDVINTLGATMLDLTPSVASSLQRQDVPSVELLYCIGEAMRQSIVDEWEGCCVNSYGPSEAAMAVTIFPVDRETKPVNIGRPFNTTSFHVRDKYTRSLAPVLAVGELCLGGFQLARGYHARDELTAKSFFEEDGQRYYETGDVVRQLGDGTFEFVGRADNQVKIRGLRVELGEIETVIKKSDESIESVSVHIMKQSAEAKDQIVGFLSRAKGNSLPSEATLKETILQFTARLLPGYMIPNVLLLLDHLPLSAAGKIDRRALLRHFQDIKVASGTVLDLPDDSFQEADWTDVEKQVRKVLSEISKETESRIGLNTSIVGLGLDSISAMQIARTLGSKGLAVSASQIMQSPTLRGIANKTTAQSETSMHNRAPRQKVLASPSPRYCYGCMLMLLQSTM